MQKEIAKWGWEARNKNGKVVDNVGKCCNGCEVVGNIKQGSDMREVAT